MSVHPPAFAALEKAEIALVSVDALALLDERITLPQVVKSLAQKEIAALAVIGAVSEDAGTMADTHSIPLFRLPDDSDLRDTERDIIRLIVEREAQLERRAQQVYQQLARLSIQNKGLAGIAEELHRITGKAIVIQDSQMAVLTAAWPQDETVTLESLTESLADDSVLRTWLSGSKLSDGTPAQTNLSLDPVGWRRCVTTIVIEGKLTGYVSLLAPAGFVDDLDRIAMQRGALVCAVEIAKRRAVDAANDRFRGELLDLILTAGASEEQAVARRASAVNYDLEQVHVAVLFALTGDTTRPLSSLASEFRATLLNTGIDTFLCTYSGMLVALCSADAPDSLRQLEHLVEEMHGNLVQSTPGIHLAAGIGRPASGLAGLRRSFSQARETFSLVQTMFAGDRVLSFGDLGVYRLLCNLQADDELKEFFSQTLAPLIQYDANHSAELVSTLEAYFSHQGNVSQTAESLYLHRNSLLYRLERISVITGLDLSDADDCFSLQLALKIRPLLNAPDSSECSTD
jgi:purine catabolism regulator